MASERIAKQSDLDEIKKSVGTAQTTADNAKNKAEAAMPLAGGTFTGDVTAYSEKRATAALRNIEVRITDTAGDLQETDKIILVRK